MDSQLNSFIHFISNLHVKYFITLVGFIVTLRGHWKETPLKVSAPISFTLFYLIFLSSFFHLIFLSSFFFFLSISFSSFFLSWSQKQHFSLVIFKIILLITLRVLSSVFKYVSIYYLSVYQYIIQVCINIFFPKLHIFL